MNMLRKLPAPLQWTIALIIGIVGPVVLIGGGLFLTIVLAPLVDLYLWTFILFTPFMLIVFLGAWVWERLRRLWVSSRPRD